MRTPASKKHDYVTVLLRLMEAPAEKLILVYAKSVAVFAHSNSILNRQRRNTLSLVCPKEQICDHNSYDTLNSPY